MAVIELSKLSNNNIQYNKMYFTLNTGLCTVQT